MTSPNSVCTMSCEMCFFLVCCDTWITNVHTFATFWNYIFRLPLSLSVSFASRKEKGAKWRQKLNWKSAIVMSAFRRKCLSTSWFKRYHQSICVHEKLPTVEVSPDREQDKVQHKHSSISKPRKIDWNRRKDCVFVVGAVSTHHIMRFISLAGQ